MLVRPTLLLYPAKFQPDNTPALRTWSLNFTTRPILSARLRFIVFMSCLCVADLTRSICCLNFFLCFKAILNFWAIMIVVQPRSFSVNTPLCIRCAFRSVLMIALAGSKELIMIWGYFALCATLRNWADSERCIANQNAPWQLQFI